MDVQRKELLEEVMTWHHRMFRELLSQHHQLVEAHIDVFGTHPITQRVYRSANKENFEEIINPKLTLDNMMVTDFMVDLCDEHVGDDGSCTVDQFHHVLDAISKQDSQTSKLTLGDKVRTCYVIDRTLHSKRVSEGDVLKLTERYQSIGARMLLQWVVDTTSRGQPDEDCANLFLRVLISIPPKDPRVLREFGSVLAAQASRQESPVMRALFNQLLALFEK
ncbi:hypothetical protein H310_02304 [Aphanomyces invadans]|uniref:Uncharacterized protein n=1 Tax=Aphanomyces invadans TaxID=157072 RepID=A0A024UQM4_9STRA|nr:hypothetical protein H310_02304 [Aphanomyces invadans]ETW07893.1 hypothetical protein H310_02304 [Aphanomyces invadans]|eukprot:XP_008863986.1 hypothetical protein H310_02304 [Aphanomyces invadans]